MLKCAASPTKKNPLSSVDICRSVKLDIKNRARETGYKQGDQQGVRFENHKTLPAFFFGNKSANLSAFSTV